MPSTPVTRTSFALLECYASRSTTPAALGSCASTGLHRTDPIGFDSPHLSTTCGNENGVSRAHVLAFKHHRDLDFFHMHRETRLDSRLGVRASYTFLPPPWFGDEANRTALHPVVDLHCNECGYTIWPVYDVGILSSYNEC